MLRALLSSACRWLDDWKNALYGDRLPSADLIGPSITRKYRPLERVVLADEVCQTLFGDYARHRATHRGDEEIGWVLLGVREEKEAIVLATLPAGADREASATHVHFNSLAQGVASRFVRQNDKRLGMVGVVHTHPGSLRHPSGGDYRGDSLWVGQLRGGEGVFGIGTADAHDDDPQLHQPSPHMQTEGPLNFSWYVLGKGDARYRRIPVELALGPDLARPLHPVWDTLETHAEGLDRLYRQQNGVTLEVLDDGRQHVLAVRLPLADPSMCLRLLLDGPLVRYYGERDGELLDLHPDADSLERGVYSILADLPAVLARAARPTPPARKLAVR